MSTSPRRIAVLTGSKEIPSETSRWYVIDVSKIYGKRVLYTELQEYVRSHRTPRLFVPDARVLTQDVANQVSHFLLKWSELEIVVVYDRPEDVPEILRYFVSLRENPDPTTHRTYVHPGDEITAYLTTVGFLTETRRQRYLNELIH